ncbi:unnamed protein product [Blepharisma stoltei]|uniref:VTT domain-containing protein n=1 Tax=Blepharisma stoltei TaxID=1481888 RepID=A0AAU9IQA2_9CILI|nr:unnamed protein product [Blepharisma stoltei]
MELNIELLKKETEENLNRNKYLLLMLLGSGIFGLFLFIQLAPPLTESERAIIYRLPWTPQEILELSQVLSKYTVTSYWYVFSLFCFFYLFLQSFAIPGPIVLSLISGTLFGRWTGLLIVSICATVGSTICYKLSDNLGKGLVIRWFPNGVVKLNKAISEQKSGLFFYLLFLRIVPLVPNWILNLASPIVGIPLKTFILATLFGLAPPNFIHISTGMALSSIGDTGLSSSSLTVLILLGILILIPPILMRNRNK